LVDDSHCADAVLSLANKITLVGDVSDALLKFTALWVQTPSDYDILVAKSFPAQWAAAHQPVFSRYTDPERTIPEHTLYTRFSLARPGGALVVCHLSCNQQLFFRQEKEKVKIVCLGCRSRCKVPVVRSDGSFLGSVDIIKARYPPQCYPTEWKLASSNPPPEPSKSATPRPRLNRKRRRPPVL